MTDEELANLIHATVMRNTPRKKVGYKPIDISVLLDDSDDDAYYPQLHYSRQYDVRGYPQMRREFVDYLEAALDAPKTTSHVRGIRTYQLTPLIRALRYLETTFPESWSVYVAIVLEGVSVLQLAEIISKRSATILRTLDHARRVVEAAYQKAYRGMLQ